MGSSGFRNLMWRGSLLIIFGLMLMSGTTHAVIYNLADGNSTVSIDVDSQHGLFDWITDGVNLAPTAGGGINDYRQWFWYGVGTNAPASIDTLTRGFTVASNTNSDPNNDTLNVNYSGAPGFEIQVTFSLAGGSLGSGMSDIGEQIHITNTNQVGNLVFHFYQYGDFQLTPPHVGNEVVSFVNSNTVHESGALGVVQETVHTPVASRQEAEPFPVTINKLNNGVSPVNLANNSGMGPGDITWAYQWDVTIAPGDTFLISKDMQTIIPEPNTALLVGFGLLGGLLGCRRQKS